MNNVNVESSEEPTESGALTSEGGTQEANQQQLNTEEEFQSSGSDSSSQDSSKAVSWENHKRALDDMHKFKQKNKELGDRIKQLEQKLEDYEQKHLKEQEDWKTLFEREKQRREEAERQANEVSESFFENQKFNKVKSLAYQAGLRGEAEDDLLRMEFDGVTAEQDERGHVRVYGAESFIEKLKKQKPHWFQQKNAPRINSGGHKKAEPQELTAEYMLELERKNHKKYKELLPKFVEQMKRQQT